MFEWFLILFYAALSCFLIAKSHLPEKTGIDGRWLIAFFIIRISSGIFYGWIHCYLYGEVDTWSNFSDSKIIYSTLSSPWVYLKLVFGINIPPPSPDIAPFARLMTCWNQPDAYFMVRFQALANIFSFENYNVNVVIYNFIVLLGLLHLFDFFKFFVRKKKSILLCIVFLFPNILFWSSGLAKDGFALAAMGFLLHGFQQQFLWPASPISRREKNSHINVRAFLSMGVGVWILSVLRFYVLILMIPLLVAFLFSKKNKTKIAIIFISSVLAFSAFGFLLDALSSSCGLLHLLTTKQQQFAAIASGNSVIQLQNVGNNFISFAENIPAAFFYVLIGPAPSGSNDWQQTLLFIQNMLLLFLYLFCILFRKKKFTLKEIQLLFFCLLLSICWIIIIGEIIPNYGAIARYKMPIELFLLIAALTILDEKKLAGKFYSAKNFASN